MVDKIEVTRNGVTRTFELTETKKGKRAGTKFFAMKITKDGLEEDLKFVGLEEEVPQLMNGILRQRSKGWSGEAEEEARKADGTIDEDKFVQSFVVLATDFSARGETIKELQARIDELVEELTSLDYGVPANIERAKELSVEIKKLQTSMSLKRRTKDEDEEVVAAK